MSEYPFSPFKVLCLVLALASVLLPAAARRAAAATRDYAVEASATVQESPPRIDFSWRADPTAAEYLVFKKAIDDSLWTGPIAVLPGGATAFSDADVAVGEAYEYSFRKTCGVITDTIAVTGGDSVTFTIRDSYGDGICCEQGLGSYKVTGCGLTYASGGAFGTVESTTFVAGSLEDPCPEVVIEIILDVFALETTWELVDEATGLTLASGGPYVAPKFGHVLAGIRCPAPEDLGTVLLLVDQPVAAPLAAELDRLRTDLIRDGYRVRRLEVADATPVASVKDLILAECASDPAISTLFLLGNISVPYSGDIHGAHAEQNGAWPADVYYGELDGPWTDYLVTARNLAYPKHRNVPGDGKFDQTYLPSDVDLMVGRVDLSRMTAFAEDEIALLRRYLDKDHAYRSGAVDVPRRGIIKDNVGEIYGVAYACTGWRNFTAFFGAGGVSEAAWLPTLETDSYLCAYGCGSGSYSSCSGVITTTDFATGTIHAVFTMLMGSYFGDWDSEDNLLRAALGSQGYPLVSFWAGRPPWHLQHMALGWPVGYSARLTQNNHLLYTIGYGGRQIHTALMGDPTLKLFVVRPPVGLVTEDLGVDGVRLAWAATADTVGGTVVGFNVYRAETLGGTFLRLNGGPVADTAFVDAAPLDARNVYSVRAVKLETTASGTFLNLSSAAIDSVERVAGVPGDPAPPGEPAVGRDTLLGSSPNPFTCATSVAFDLTAAARVALKVYDAGGRLVRTAEAEALPAGRHTLEWDGREADGRRAASGVYFISVSTDLATLTTKVVKLQ